MQHLRNEVWEAILHNDPGTLPESIIEEIENHILGDANELISRLSEDRLGDRSFMNIVICESLSDVKDRLRKAAARQGWQNHRRGR
ncbi:hypothetical protein [Paludibaculum fermentans]|uniref:hypothetical protein n=1 Tax=Paludibaculum fermentans TaxID=1473598 RepID=UPI003EB82474